MDLTSPLTDKKEPRTVTSKRTVQNERIVLSATKANVLRTPSHQRFKDVLDTENFQTPKQLVKVSGRPVTPRLVRNTSTPTRGPSIYAAARQLFSQTSSSIRLIGRDVERRTLDTFLSSSIENKKGGCLYISGPPGTGKSALLEEVFKSMDSNDAVKATYINCVSIKTSKDIYTKLLEDLAIDGNTTAKTADAVLSAAFTPKGRSAGKTYVVMLDEIDHLTSDFSVLGQLFEWALTNHSRLTLVGIANALDLTDRFLPQLKSRNLKPEILLFQSYTAPQITSIITKRLQSLLEEPAVPNFVPFVQPVAIQLCAKKVASQTGDIRKAFSIIHRCIDLVEKESRQKEERAASLSMSPSKHPLGEKTHMNSPPTGLVTPPNSSPLKPEVSQSPMESPRLSGMTAENAPRVGIAHVARIAAAVFNNGTLQRLSSLNLQQKAVLCCLVSMEKQRLARSRERDPFSTPSKSSNLGPATIREVFNTYSILCKREKILHALTITEFRDVMAGLETLGLVNESRGKMGSFKAAAAMTPTRTPSKLGRGAANAEDQQMCSAVTEKEIEECTKGPGMEILRALFMSE